MEFPPKDSFLLPFYQIQGKKTRVPIGDQKGMILFRDRFALEGELTTDSVCGKNNTSYGNPTPA